MARAQCTVATEPRGEKPIEQIPTSRNTDQGKAIAVDETIRENLLSRFVAYLDGLDHDGSGEAPPATAEEASEEADLFAVFVELAGVRNEVRTQSRIVKEALDRFRSVFDTLQASHTTLEQELKRARADAHDRERAVLKPLLLDVIDVRDRLAAGLKPAPAALPRRWYERLLPEAKRAAEAQAWREGLQMTLRRVDALLANQRICVIETVGLPFDPRHAAAVATVADPSAADGTVVEEVRAGFLWDGELLRPAEVTVARRDARNGERT
jgi:molecular chaperone GrpE